MQVALKFNNSNVIQSTLWGFLDGCRGFARPRAADVAKALARATGDERWEEAVHVEGIKNWYSKRVSTLQSTTLTEWWNGDPSRHLVLWTHKLKNEATLGSYLLSLDAQRPPDCPTVPYNLQNIPFAAYKEWIQKRLKKDKKAKTATAKALDLAQNATHLLEQTHITCALCACTATRKPGGRLLEKCTACDLHSTCNIVGQLFLKNIHGRLLNICRHCMVRCKHCGCTALRDLDMPMETYASNCTDCRKAHLPSQTYFPAKKRKSVVVGSDGDDGDDDDDDDDESMISWSLRDVCKECQNEFARCVRLKRHSESDARSSVARQKVDSAGEVECSSSILILSAFVSPPSQICSTKYSAQDLKSIPFYKRWKTMTPRSTVRKNYLQHAGAECNLLEERVRFLFNTIFPRLEKRK